jgi:hypothetical protein
MKACKAFIIVFIFILTLPTTAFALFLGPYWGRVLDSRTGEPIPGASVLVYWEKWVADIMGGHSELIKATLVYTDDKGAYQIPRTFCDLGLLAALESTTVIIYEPGYEAHIIGISHLFPREDETSLFKETDYVVKLDRIPPNFNHNKHYERMVQALYGFGFREIVLTADRAHLRGEKFDDERLSRIRARNELLGRAEWEERRR